MIAVIAIMSVILTVIIVISMCYVVTSKKPEDKKIKYNGQLYRVLESCKNECGEGSLSKRIDIIIDMLKYSDVNTPDSAEEIEQMVLEKVSELHNNIISRKNIDANINLDEIEQLTKNRTAMTKYSK